MKRISTIVLVCGLAAGFVGLMASAATKSERAAAVTTIRVPNNGIQPQVAVDSKGVIHLIYYTGDSGKGDLYYVRSNNAGATFSEPLKVNSHPGSAIAAGNIRGAHLAIGRNDRVHAAWNGTYELDIPGVTKAWMKHPTVYTRLNSSGTAFEPEKNVITAAYGLDGGGALAADSQGHVYVFWHAPIPGTEGEVNRRVWVARSNDDGATFERERAAFETPTGACGCCGMSALADNRGNVYALFRSATEMVHRDIYLLASRNHGDDFQKEKISEWNVGACVMSMEHLSQNPAGILATWETLGNIYYGVIDPATGKMAQPVAAPGDAKGRKYPVVVGNARGETLMAWTEGMGWKKGGSLAWQIFDKNGKPTGGNGRADGVPAWSLVAAFTRPDGGFTIIY